jgi:hypothetical protein
MCRHPAAQIERVNRCDVPATRIERKARLELHCAVANDVLAGDGHLPDDARASGNGHAQQRLPDAVRGGQPLRAQCL